MDEINGRKGEMVLYQVAESKANRDNVRCLFALAIIILVCEGLNEIGIFDVAPYVMRAGAVCGCIGYLIPVIALGKSLKIFSRDTSYITYSNWHKYLIIYTAWLGTFAMCITLTHHTVIVMAVPIMIMAMYRNTKRLVPLTMALGTMCVLFGVYGGYFFGCFDANLLHMELNDNIVADLAFRREIATPKRMVELLIHYAIAREIAVLALTMLGAKISQRSDEMLRQQAMLQRTVEREMQRTNEIQWEIIDGMANLIENRDSSTGEHVKRTSFYVRTIVDQLSQQAQYRDTLSDEKGDTIVRAAPLHDIGKIVVVDHILQKPGRLTSEEYEEIKLHASEGAKVIQNVLGNVEDEEFISAASEIAGGHHERWDGKGYPQGLAGEEIPLSARIMAVADVFDALVSKRVYKEPIPPEEAFAIIESESGKQFDPDVVQAFCKLKPDIMEYLNY